MKKQNLPQEREKIYTLTFMVTINVRGLSLFLLMPSLANVR